MRGPRVSYILEALKKSEQEREIAAQSINSEVVNEVASANELEGAVEVAAQPVEAQPKWLLNTVYLALLILLVLILFKLFYSPTSYTDQKVEESSLQLAEQYEGKDSNNGLKVEVRAQEIPETELQDAVNEKSVPLLQENKLIAIEQAPIHLLATMPTLKISSHIYSPQADRRSIVVNGQRMVEGDFVAPNIQILEITHQGMVVSAEDLALEVSRSRGWK